MSNPPPAALGDYEDGEHRPIKRRVWQIVQGVLIGFGCLVLALLISAIVINVMPKKVKVRTILEVKSLGHASSPLETLTSDPVLERVILDADMTSWFAMGDGPELRSRVRGMISVRAVSGTSLVELVVEDTNKYRATTISEGIVKAYEATLKEEAMREGQLFLNDLDRQLKEKEAQLGEARGRMEKALEEFRSDSNGTKDAEGKGNQPAR